LRIDFVSYDFEGDSDTTLKIKCGTEEVVVELFPGGVSTVGIVGQRGNVLTVSVESGLLLKSNFYFTFSFHPTGFG